MTDPSPKFSKMLVAIVWQILLLCIFQVFVAENAALQDCSLATVKCLCGEEPNYEIKYFDIRSFNARDVECSEILSAGCEMFSCSYIPEDYLDKELYDSVKKIPYNPVKITVPPLDAEALQSHSKSRQRRFPKSCNDSISPIRHAVMDCSVWPEFMTCTINCTHGYAMIEDGKAALKTTRNCRESESTWQPKASFPVCEPYINCKAILVTPGDLDCKTSGPMISYCDISCDANEDKDEVPKKRYECLDENFAKTLPHCATVVKDVNLIPHPNSTSQGPEKALQDPQKASQKASQVPQKAPRGPQKAPKRT